MIARALAGSPKVLLLDKGHLIVQGNHHQLMALSNGRYRAMYELQQQAQKVEQIKT